MFCNNPECPDALRPGSSGEYRNDVTSCPICGCALGHEPATHRPPPEYPPHDEFDFVIVAHVNTAPSIAIARAMLDEAGIRHFIRNQQSFSPWGGPGSIDFLESAELAVEPDRVTEAQRLLSQLQEAVPEETEPALENESEVTISILKMGERRRERQRSAWMGSQLRARPSLARVVFFGVASVLFFAAVVIGLLESERINGFWLFLGVMMGIIALDTQRRRRQTGRNDGT